MEIKVRLKKFLVYQNIGQTAFEKRVGISNGYITKVKESIGSQQLEKIFSVYPNINLEWLVTGKGNMLRNEEENKISLSEETLIMMVNQKDDKIEALSRQVGKLEAIIEILRKEHSTK